MAKILAIKDGYYVALCLIPGVAPQNAYIGQVKATDEFGIRINPVHWDEKLDAIHPNTEDFFVPWENINSILVCTEEHPVRRFIRDRAPKWQAEVESMYSREIARPKKTAPKD